MKKKLFITFIFSIIVIAIGLIFVIQPLRLPELVIKNKILKETPIGSDYVDVEKFVKEKGWYNYNYVGNGGFWNQDTDEVIGVRSIKGDLGEYPTLFDTYVTACWAFDEKDRLIDVWVWKSIDSL